MSRKTGRLTITNDNRDKGKTFLMTEMSADRAERWALRALLALSSAGVEVPDHATNAGMAGIASVGVSMLSKLNFDVAEPLLAEMMDCVQIDMGNGIIRDLIDGDGADIEEVLTRFQLRKAVLELHLGFSIAVPRQTTESASTATIPAI